MPTVRVVSPVIAWVFWHAAVLAAEPAPAPAVADICAYADSATAQQHWQPQFGSPPVRVETLPDGSTCLALDAEFAKPGARACWDWHGPLDLSRVGRVTFDGSATNGDVVATTGLYFGTPNGWYATFVGGMGPEWTPRTLTPGSSGTEGKPDGLDKVNTFRFSVWSSGAGKTVLRLRHFRARPVDPAENFLKNGSLEIDSGGLPYAWGSGHWGVGNLPWAADMDLWRRHFRLDHTVARHGGCSLCLQNAADLPLLKAVSVWVTPPRRASVSGYVCSAWLKSDRDALPVTLSCGGRNATVTVGRDWSQAALSGVPPGERTVVTVAPGTSGTLWIDAVQLQAGTAATAEYHLADGEDALAAREQAVDWSPPPRVAAVAAGRQTAGPVAPAKVTIDANGRFLLDGVPYLLHAFGLEFVSDPGVLDAVARAGFRDVCVQIRETLTTAQVQAIFDRCAAVGLRIVPWLDGRIALDRFREHIVTLKTHPALLCWYVFDEPSGKLFAEAEARLKLASELDPAHPAYINYLGNRLDNQAGAIYSTDIYPIPHGQPRDAINGVASMAAAAAKEHKPVWMWLQGTGYAYWMDREPTPRELSCMAYGSLIAGARGLYYFAQVPRSRQCFAEMRALCVELDAVGPAMFSLDPAPAVACDRPEVMAKAFAHQGQWWVVAVNTQRDACPVRLTLPGAAGTVEVVFEDRRLPVAADGGWQDKFGVYERHVYRLGARR